MAKLVKFNVVDGAGASAAGQKLIAGGLELTTGDNGFAQALLDDGTTQIALNGKVVYDGPVDALKSVEVFTLAGQRRA
jgi:hypothetical protein